MTRPRLARGMRTAKRLGWPGWGPATGACDVLCASVQAVEGHRAAGQDAVLRCGRGALEPLTHHSGCAREKAVWMRVVGRPQNLVGADEVREYLEAGFDRFERNPAITLEEFARPRLQVRIVEELIIEMAVHAVEPRRDPAATRLQERDADLRVPLAHPAPDHRKAGQHHLHRVRHDVPGGAALETVDADRWHAARTAFMEPDRHVELPRSRPERLVIGVVDHLVVVRGWAQEGAT